MLLEDVVEVALVAQSLLGDGDSQARLGGVGIAFLALDDGLGAVLPEDDGRGVVEDNPVDLEDAVRSLDRGSKIGSDLFGVQEAGQILGSGRLIVAVGEIGTFTTINGVQSGLRVAAVDHKALESGLGVNGGALGLDIHDLDGDHSAASVNDRGALMGREGHDVIRDGHSCFSFQNYNKI